MGGEDMKTIQQLKREKGDIERELILMQVLSKSQDRVRKRALKLLRSIKWQDSPREFKAQLKSRIKKSENEILSMQNEKRKYNKRKEEKKTTVTTDNTKK